MIDCTTTQNMCLGCPKRLRSLRNSKVVWRSARTKAMQNVRSQSRCIRRWRQSLGRSDKWATGSPGPFSKLLEHAAPRQLLGAACDLEKNTEGVPLCVLFEVCHRGSWNGSHWTFRELRRCLTRRKMVCWGGVRPRPGPRLPPLEGGAGSHALGCLLSSHRCASHR